MAATNNPQVDLPLTETTLFILLSLAPGARHGYAIMKDVRALSQARVILSTGTLYGALKRLLEQEWIRRVDDSETNDTAPGRSASGRERKAYALTEQGRRVLGTELARLGELVQVAKRRMLEAQA